MTQIFEFHPEAAEILVVNLPPGATARVHHPDGRTEDYQAVFHGEMPLIAVIPGDKTHLGWGVKVCLYGNMAKVRNGHHSRDRATWHAAAKTVSRGGAVYLKMGQVTEYRKTYWAAQELRTVSTDGQAA